MSVFNNKLWNSYICHLNFELEFFICAFLFKVPFFLSTKVNICDTFTSLNCQVASEKKKCLDTERKEKFLHTFKELPKRV